MIGLRIALLTLSLFIVQPCAPLRAAEIEGVRFTDSVRVADRLLILRGYDLLRYMIVIKAYVGALYLPAEAKADEVFQPIAKRLELSYFHDIKAEDFASATREKIADNVTPDELGRLGEQINQFVALYEDVRVGDRYALTFDPEQGTELALNGKSLGTVPGNDFASAIFAVWLGEDPIDREFRDTLLGNRSR